MHLKHLPSCVFICARKLQASANFLLHNSQECGLSPTKNEPKTYNQQTKYIIYGQWKRCVIYRFVLAELLLWMNMQHVKGIAAYNSIFGFIFDIFFFTKVDMQTYRCAKKDGFWDWCVSRNLLSICDTWKATNRCARTYVISDLPVLGRISNKGYIYVVFPVWI